MNKFILLLIIPFLSFGQDQSENNIETNVEFYLKKGIEEYLNFNIPSYCTELSYKNDAPEGTVCIFFCNDNLIMFVDDYDYYAIDNKIQEKKDVVKKLKTNKYQEEFKRAIEIEENITVNKVSFEYVNDMPALKAEYVFNDMVVSRWKIYELSRRLTVITLTEKANVNIFKKTINSISLTLLNKEQALSIRKTEYIKEYDENGKLIIEGDLVFGVEEVEPGNIISIKGTKEGEVPRKVKSEHEGKIYKEKRKQHKGEDVLKEKVREKGKIFGKKTYYKTDDKGKILRDSDGNPIVTSKKEIRQS